MGGSIRPGFPKERGIVSNTDGARKRYCGNNGKTARLGFPNGSAKVRTNDTISYALTSSRIERTNHIE